MKEYLHTLYQFTDDWIVDDSKFRERFAVAATPMEEALEATLSRVGGPGSPDDRAAQEP